MSIDNEKLIRSMIEAIYANGCIQYDGADMPKEHALKACKAIMRGEENPFPMYEYLVLMSAEVECQQEDVGHAYLGKRECELFDLIMCNGLLWRPEEVFSGDDIEVIGLCVQESKEARKRAERCQK